MIKHLVMDIEKQKRLKVKAKKLTLFLDSNFTINCF